jgi:hypothetical protein
MSSDIEEGSILVHSQSSLGDSNWKRSDFLNGTVAGDVEFVDFMEEVHSVESSHDVHGIFSIESSDGVFSAGWKGPYHDSLEVGRLDSNSPTEQNDSKELVHFVLELDVFCLSGTLKLRK